MQEIFENRKSELINICNSLNVKRLYAFWSVVSEIFRDDSDIDFLISFLDKLSIEQYTDNYFNLQYKLRELFCREIDLITEKTLSNPYLIERIEQTKELIYES